MGANKCFQQEQLARFGARVRRLRTERRVDQLSLAQQSGYRNSNAITQIEKGTMYPTLEKVFLIAKALDIPPSALFPPEADAQITPYEALCETTQHLPVSVVEALMGFLATWVAHDRQCRGE
jgi:transcriptional regulator with XRE-family HTH domain